MSGVCAFAPGRVNLLGEHTDYNDGLALPFAVGLGITAVAERRPGRRIEVVAADLGERDRFDLDGIEPVAGWRAFVRGTAAELLAAGHELAGARIRIAADLPPGAGLSSSAALEVAVALALLRVSGAPAPEPVRLAGICAAAEARWAGAETGLLDQLASLLGRAGRALRIDFRGPWAAPVELAPSAWRFVVAPSGPSRALAASGYNERRRECRAAAERLGVRSLRDASPDEVGRLPAPLDRRLRHVISENARVDEGVQALRAGTMDELGRLLDASHASLRDDYDASTPEVEAAVQRLKSAGAAGARMMGGGFGGAVLALLPPGMDVPPGAVAVEPCDGARVTGVRT